MSESTGSRQRTEVAPGVFAAMARELMAERCSCGSPTQANRGERDLKALRRALVDGLAFGLAGIDRLDRALKAGEA